MEPIKYISQDGSKVSIKHDYVRKKGDGVVRFIGTDGNMWKRDKQQIYQVNRIVVYDSGEEFDSLDLRDEALPNDLVSRLHEMAAGQSEPHEVMDYLQEYFQGNEDLNLEEERYPRGYESSEED